MENLQDQIALITGGGSGICLAFAQTVHAAGCSVVLADLALHPTASEWIESLSPVEKTRVVFRCVDVTDWNQLESAFDFCTVQFGGIPTIVVPGAGVYEPSSNSFWADCDEDSRYRVLDINLVHPIKMTRIAVSRLVRANKSGTVIHIASIAAQRPSIVAPLYAASKRGLDSFIRSMAPLDHLSKIRVVGVAPGAIATPLLMERPEVAKILNLKQAYLLSPKVVSRAMFTLLTESRYAAGTVLEVCHEDDWREVSLLNDPGPQGPASQTGSESDEALKGIREFL